MALVPMQKINLFVHKKDRSAVMSFLQEHGVMHLTDAALKEGELQPLGSDEDAEDLQYKVAELDFAVNFLAPYQGKKKGLQAMIDGDHVEIEADHVVPLIKSYDWQTIVNNCKSLEEELVSISNEAKANQATRDKLLPWKAYHAPLSAPLQTGNAAAFFGMVSVKQWDQLKAELHAISPMVVVEFHHTEGGTVYFKVVCEKSFLGQSEGKTLALKGELVELPALEGSVTEVLMKLKERMTEIHEAQKQLKHGIRTLAKELKSLRVVYDFYNWQLIAKNASKHFASTSSTVMMSGWVPKKGISSLKSDLEKVTASFELAEVSPQKDEEPPVLLENKGFMKPFQSVTGIYGLPLPHEMDPTPYLAAFFILFFGLALTDALYGLLMFAIMFSVLRFLKIPKESQGMIRLLMYAGLVTFFAGALFGGWASLDPAQAPGWMTTVGADGELAFVGQKISAIKDPMAVLILSLILGYIQVFVGVVMNFVHKFRTESKKDALMDHFPWVFLLFCIGLTIMTWRGIIIPSNFLKFMLYLCVFSALVVAFIKPKLFKKPAIWMIPLIPLKLIFDGILRLYGLVGYLSDVLSYSRLLALGLATSIIGLAVNTIAGMVNGIPVVGIILAIVVLAGGHTFNIGINALGAFIHSGRLQFVEFFTKFLEGGGQAFRPLRKESRFVRLADRD